MFHIITIIHLQFNQPDRLLLFIECQTWFVIYILEGFGRFGGGAAKTKLLNNFQVSSYSIKAVGIVYPSSPWAKMNPYYQEN